MVLLLLTSLYASAIVKDSIRNIQYLTVDKAIEVQSAEILKTEQTLKTIFLCGFLLAVGGCFLVAHLGKLKSKEFTKVISLQNVKLSEISLQAQSFGYILNSALFPCCLVNSDGKISWQNEAFVKFYGKNPENYSIFYGLSDEKIKSELENFTLPTTFFVQVKNIDQKVFGFKRTLIPLQAEKAGSKSFAVIENIEYGI